MAKAITHYLDGMISWGDLSRSEQVWVWINRTQFCPADAAASFSGE